jgi:inhibitor of KinA sporulation pathway (predicted exonuclease)
VDEIKSELNSIKPKIEELVQDEFVLTFHIPQCTVIKNNFDKLYSSVIFKVNSYVKPTVNGGAFSAGNLDTASLHQNWRYYL